MQFTDQPQLEDPVNIKDLALYETWKLECFQRQVSHKRPKKTLRRGPHLRRHPRDQIPNLQINLEGAHQYASIRIKLILFYYVVLCMSARNIW